MPSYNTKVQVPNDIHKNNLFIPGEHLYSQHFLNKIQEWTFKQKMELNEEMTKVMILNFTRTKQFSTRLTLNDKPLETVKETKLLGTVITDAFK